MGITNGELSMSPWKRLFFNTNLFSKLPEREKIFGESKMKNTDFKFKLGSKLRDTITGLEGICVVRNQWLNGCNQYGIQPEELTKDGGVKDKGWFDEPQLEVVVEKVHEESRHTGGPGKAIPQSNQM